MANGRVHPIKKRYYFPAEIFSADAVLIHCWQNGFQIV